MPEPNESEPLRGLLGRWRVNCARGRQGNYVAANAFARRHTGLGIIAVSLSAVVGTSVFASLGKQVEPWLQIMVGSMSVLSAVLAALQTFLRDSDRASSHRLTAARYAALVREIDTALALVGAIAPDTVERVRRKMDKLAEDAPEMPEHLWARAMKEVPAGQSGVTSQAAG